MIRSERLILRATSESDNLAHFRIHSDPATNLHNPAGPLTQLQESREILQDWRQHWEQHGFGYWAASLRAAPEDVVGFGGVARKTIDGADRLNLYFRFSPQVWGQGLATELGRYALGEALESEAGERVFALVRPDNALSIKVLRKLRMREVDKIDDVQGLPPSLLYAT